MPRPGNFRDDNRRQTKLIALPLAHARGGSGVSSMELRELEHSPQLWHNSRLSISVTTIITHN